jgi:hypothetical protein
MGHMPLHVGVVEGEIVHDEPGLTPRILPTNYRRGGAFAKSRSMPCSPMTTRASRS